MATDNEDQFKNKLIVEEIHDALTVVVEGGDQPALVIVNDDAWEDLQGFIGLHPPVKESRIYQIPVTVRPLDGVRVTVITREEMEKGCRRS